MKITRLLHSANVAYDRLLKFLVLTENTDQIFRSGEGEVPAFIITLKGRRCLVEFKKQEENSSI